MNEVEYLSKGSKIVANLYIPEDLDEWKQHALVIITPPNKGVKELILGLYTCR